jgi:hypothetical protein
MTLYEYIAGNHHLKGAQEKCYRQDYSDYLLFLREFLPKLRRKRLPFWRRTKATKLDTLYRCLAQPIPVPGGLIIEFGVFKGHTIRMIGDAYPSEKVYGFDSFEGLPEDGRKDWQADFSVDGQLPEVPPNVTLVKGYFDNTLPAFLEEHPDRPIAILHLDCDIYSSTKTVLSLCGPHIVPETLIVFDELLHNLPFLHNEMLALYEFLRDEGRNLEWVAIRGKVMTIDDFLEGLDTHPAKMADWRKRGYEQAVALRIV